MDAMTDHTRRTYWAIQGFKKEPTLLSEVNRKLNTRETAGNRVSWLELNELPRTSSATLQYNVSRSQTNTTPL
jgi:hypothetical protein